MPDFLRQICFLFWNRKKIQKRTASLLRLLALLIGEMITQPDTTQADKFWRDHWFSWRSIEVRTENLTLPRKAGKKGIFSKSGKDNLD